MLTAPYKYVNPLSTTIILILIHVISKKMRDLIATNSRGARTTHIRSILQSLSNVKPKHDIS
jgi:hypothetical protein